MTNNQKKKIYIGVAWPYANGEQHIGHIAGAYLPPDIFARYNRMIGNDVLLISGTDTHGTPVTVKAEQENVKPIDIVERYHKKFIEVYQKLGLTFDLFTHTHTQNHQEVVHKLFKDHLKKGYIYTSSSKQLFDPEVNRFLPDRYIEGICPLCGAEGARGDQCDNCQKTYDAIELKSPVSKITGNKNLVIKETKHFYLDLAKLNEPLLEWVKSGKSHWRSNVLNFTLGELEKRTLRGRPITRDLTWGIPIPVEGYDDKRIYVWYEAVIGYLSGSIEWAALSNKSDEWKKWWDIGFKDDVKGYYFIGKDNITFHTIIWPAMLYAYGGLCLPYDVPSNEYLNSYGRKFSKSKGGAIYVLDVLERYQPDAWRYALTAMAPESSDVDFTWDDFIEKINNELIASWGNLVNRLLGFAYKKFNHKVPQPGELLDIDNKILNELRMGFNNVGKLYESVKLKSSLEEIRRLCQKVNQYLNDTAPWTEIKKNPNRAATTVYVGLQCIDWLTTMWAPILPESSQIIYSTLGYKGQLFGVQFTETVKDEMGEHLVLRYNHDEAKGKWALSELLANQEMSKPTPPFIKLDPDEVINIETSDS